MDDVEFLAVQDVVRIHAHMIARYGGQRGLRDPALLESAVAMPRQRFGGEFLHPTFAEMAAALAFHLIRNHPFVDGNKRVGAAAIHAFYRLNGREDRWDSHAFCRIIEAVATGEAGKRELAVFLRDRASAQSF